MTSKPKRGSRVKAGSEKEGTEIFKVSEFKQKMS
jgi:hypothetical protein